MLGRSPHPGGYSDLSKGESWGNACGYGQEPCWGLGGVVGRVGFHGLHPWVQCGAPLGPAGWGWGEDSSQLGGLVPGDEGGFEGGGEVGGSGDDSDGEALFAGGVAFDYAFVAVLVGGWGFAFGHGDDSGFDDS